MHLAEFCFDETGLPAFLQAESATTVKVKSSKYCVLDTTRSCRKWFSFDFQHMGMKYVGVKRIIIALFHHGFLDLNHLGNICCIFQNLHLNQYKFSTALIKYHSNPDAFEKIRS